jgi:hypothetical protein
MFLLLFFATVAAVSGADVQRYTFVVGSLNFFIIFLNFYIDICVDF